jgi:hypothetical protein
MAHFAEIDNNGIVLRVLIIPNTEEANGHNYLANDLGLGGNWIQTSYNGNIRKNFAGIGYTYDAVRDAFIEPEPSNAIGFDENTCQWITPPRESNEAAPE